jgi:hypothetical protein
VDSLPPAERQRWNVARPVIYIGRSRRPLARRSAEFRRQYGKNAPHRGGQAVKPLSCDLWVYWSAASDPSKAEADMLEILPRQCGNASVREAAGSPVAASESPEAYAAFVKSENAKWAKIVKLAKAKSE